MKSSILALTLTIATLAMPSAGRAEPGAANICPQITISPTAPQNLAQNPGFEISCNPASCTEGNCGASAALHWRLHAGDHQGAFTTTSCVTPSQVPEKGGQKMLRVTTNGPEGGVWQALTPSSKNTMLSVWVRVRTGQVVIQLHTNELQAGGPGPKAWSTKQGEWEQLRICSADGVNVDRIVIYNQDLRSSIFDIDRVEVKRPSTW